MLASSRPHLSVVARREFSIFFLLLQYRIHSLKFSPHINYSPEANIYICRHSPLTIQMIRATSQTILPIKRLFQKGLGNVLFRRHLADNAGPGTTYIQTHFRKSNIPHPLQIKKSATVSGTIPIQNVIQTTHFFKIILF